MSCVSRNLTRMSESRHLKGLSLVTLCPRSPDAHTSGPYGRRERAARERPGTCILRAAAPVPFVSRKASLNMDVDMVYKLQKAYGY